MVDGQVAAQGEAFSFDPSQARHVNDNVGLVLALPLAHLWVCICGCIERAGRGILPVWRDRFVCNIRGPLYHRMNLGATGGPNHPLSGGLHKPRSAKC